MYRAETALPTGFPILSLNKHPKTPAMYFRAG